ncbi:MAG TPA: DUF2948 family protein [Stellaceae bacterium]|nr:DUF2948 family protein [Stellaceae bacterium]
MGLDERRAALSLRAEDADDLAVLSACLQDALVLVGDLAYVGEDKGFMLVANRFRWERGERSARGERGHERILSGVLFSAVTSVSYRGFRRGDNERLLVLLAIRAEPAEEGAAILLEFAGGAAVRLQAAGIDCRVRDLGEPWPTPWRPRHETDEAG